MTQVSRPATTGFVLPAPEERVTDGAGVLSAEEISDLDRQLEEVERRGLAQMLIYITPSLPRGEVLEDLTLRNAKAWGIGRANIDDGLVIFVFFTDRKVRIELGLGLERVISNEEASRVITEFIAPAFGRAEYGEGLRGAVRELTRLLSVAATEQPPAARRGSE
jgi:uncharacterized protein